MICLSVYDRYIHNTVPIGSGVCPGQLVRLTYEIMSGSSFLYWTVSDPNLATTRKRVVTDQGALLVPEFRTGFTEFNITRTYESPLISQLLINNVTTEINRSTIYCSEEDNENGAPVYFRILDCSATERSS